LSFIFLCFFLTATQPVFENVSIAADAASSSVVIDDEQSVQSVENETSTDETDQKKSNVKQISTSFVQIEKTVEICPDDDGDVKSTVENNKEEKESRDPLDDSDDEQDKPRHDKYSPPDEEDEADDPDDDD
jgi:hypothetical protein